LWTENYSLQNTITAVSLSAVGWKSALPDKWLGLNSPFAFKNSSGWNMEQILDRKGKYFRPDG